MPRRSALLRVLVLPVVAGAGLALAAPVAATEISVASEAEYRAALTTLSGDAAGPHTIVLTADITITGGTDPNYTGTEDLTIQGGGHTLDGGGTRRILFVENGANVTFDGVAVTNAASTTNPALGGAVLNPDGDVEVRDSTFVGNEADSGGGTALGGAIQTTSGDVTVVDSTFADNHARGDTTLGGAIQNTGGTITISGSTFDGNTSNGSIALGGAIQQTTGTIEVTNSTLTENDAGASGSGGAIQQTAGTITVTHATFADNSPSGGNTVAASSGALTSFGSVFATTGGGPQCSSSVTSLGYTYSTDATCTSGATGDVSGGADPALAALGDFGGPTPTRPPAVDSPLVDAIPVADCDPGVTVDQRGVSRPQDGDEDGTDGCDIGAVELEPEVPPPPPPPPGPEPPAVGPIAAAPGFTG